MAKVSFWSPESHGFAAEQFCKFIGCELELGPVTEYPGTDRQPYRTYKTELTPEQAKYIRTQFAEICGSRKLETIVKGIVDGYKASLDSDVAGQVTATSGIIKAGKTLRALIGITPKAPI